MNKYIAKYLRLSLDDDGIGESSSIGSQRQIIEHYISTMPDFAGLQVKEFVDDGYSGTNFDRPGVKSLLEAVRRGEVCCIIVKDLSRFGRKYLEVGKYIEQLFPYLGIRFIAVGDHYDSNNHKGTTADIDVAVRNMLNAMYSSDVSKKVKTAKQTQARQGKYASAFAPYGYKKDPTDIHRIVIDEPAAEVVRHIFALACDEKGPTQIALTLNAQNVLTPAEYKRARGSKMTVKGVTETLWSSGAVIRILRDERYTGVFVGGKSEAGKLGTGERKYAAKEDWIRIPESHPAIITQEVWDEVIQNRSKYTGRHSKPDTGRVLYKRVRCGYCGHIMRFRADGKSRYYYCETSRYADNCGCLRERYDENELVSVVKTVVQSQVTAMLDMKKLSRDEKKSAEQNVKSADSVAQRLAGEIGQLQSFKRQLYEQYKNGVLEKAAYIREREAAEADISAKTEKREALLTQVDEQARIINSANQFFGSFLEYQAVTEPSDEMVNALVDAVIIHSKDRIEIVFSFRDEWDRVMQELEALRQEAM